MLSIVGGSHLCYSRPRRLLPDLSTDSYVRSQLRLPVKRTSIGCSTSWHPRVPWASLGSPTQWNWNVTHRHILALNLIASAAVLSTAWLFFSAIPAILASRKASESLENLLDVKREQLPDAMAAVRLSGMEISDLTMELSHLGQGIAGKVKTSVHVAEEKLRQFASLSATETKAPTVLSKVYTNYPPLAKYVRDMKEGIVKSRSSLQMFITFTFYFRLLRNFLAVRAQDKTR